MPVVEPKLNQKQNMIQVFLRLHNGNGCKLVVSKLITLEEFKKNVAQTQLDIPSQFHLIFKGKYLRKNDVKIANLGLKDQSIVHIHNDQPQGPPKLKLDVSFFYKGEKMVIRAGIQETILSLKIKIFRLIGISPKNQMVIFRGTKLMDEQTLAFYHILEDSLLCLLTIADCQGTDNSETTFDEGRELISETLSVNVPANHHFSRHVFRSESMGMQIDPYQVEIRENNKDELLLSKDFQFQILNPMNAINMLKPVQELSNRQNITQGQCKFQINSQQMENRQMII